MNAMMDPVATLMKIFVAVLATRKKLIPWLLTRRLITGVLTHCKNFVMSDKDKEEAKEE